MAKRLEEADKLELEQYRKDESRRARDEKLLWLNRELKSDKG